MKSMAKYLLLLCLTLSSFIAVAHQPDISSTMLVEREDGSWILQIRSALTAFEYEINTHYGKDAYPTAEKFQELVISHVTENLSIHFNENDVAVLQNPHVKLAHETNVIFEVLGVPQNINSVTVTNSSFKDINRNQGALIVIKEGFQKEQFLLKKENNHTAKLKIHDSKFLLLSDNKNVTSSWSSYYLLIGLIILVNIGVVFLFTIRGKYSSKGQAIY